MEEVKKRQPDIKSLAFTVSTNAEDIRRLFKAGVDGPLFGQLSRRAPWSHGLLSLTCPSRRRKTVRNDEYLCGLRRVRIPRSNGISPGKRPIAITSRSGLSSRKRGFEPGRNCHRSLLLCRVFLIGGLQGL